MDYNNLFAFPLHLSSISNDNFQIITNSVNQYIKDNPQNFKKAWNCSTISTFSIPKDQNINCETLNSEIINQTNLYYNKWDFDNLNLSLDTIWINISPPNSYQERHHHLSYNKKMLFSGVLYIDTLPNSGKLILHNPLNTQLNFMPPTKKFGNTVEITPQNGLLVSFPSWLDHEVYSNTSSQNRISVSWNIKVN